MEFSVVEGIEVVGGNLGVHVVIVARADFGRSEILFKISVPSAPGYIVHVAEGVDVDCIYVSGGEDEVLEGLGGISRWWE